jgi:hypothetical protein
MAGYKNMMEVENNREKIYNYFKDKTNVLTTQCLADLQMGENTKRYLEWLTLRNHLTRVKRTIEGKRQYVYNLGSVEYVREIAPPTQKEVDAADLVASVTRVYKLLDRPKGVEAKREKKASGYAGNMQSSMQTFITW